MNNQNVNELPKITDYHDDALSVNEIIKDARQNTSKK